MTVGREIGNIAISKDSFKHSNMSKFSTTDNDVSVHHCSSVRFKTSGGWWWVDTAGVSSIYASTEHHFSYAYLSRVNTSATSPCSVESCRTHFDNRVFRVPLVHDLPHFLFPLIPLSITSFSIPRSSIVTGPKYSKSACFTVESCVHSGLMFQAPIH